MSKHTPGPWIVRVAGPHHYPYAITAPNESPDRKGGIRDITRWGAISMPSSAEGRANARLIAEAPAMLDALRELIQATDALQAFEAAHPSNTTRAWETLWEARIAAHDRARAILARIDGKPT